MLQDRGQENNVVVFSKAPGILDRSALDHKPVLLASHPRKCFRHLYAANTPPSVGRATKEFPAAATELEHTARAPEHGSRKAGQSLSLQDLFVRIVVLKVVLPRFRIRIEIRKQGGRRIHAMALRAPNGPRLDALPCAMSTTSASA